MRIFVTGARGQLGRALCAALTTAGHAVQGTDSDTADITQPAQIAAALAAAAPELVIHSAAMTYVDGCAQDPAEALRVNGLGTRNVALACQPAEIPLLYISTNEVFDGTQRTPYDEWAAPRPINPYGYSKWAGEQHIQALLRRYYIVRTAWLFAPGGNNFIHKILAHPTQPAPAPLRIVVDEVSHPTYVPDLAEAVNALAATNLYGIYHLVNAESCSRYAFARYALNAAGHAATPIVPLTLAEFARPSTPPPYTALHNIAGAAAGITLRPWQAAVDDFLSTRTTP